MPRRTKEDAVDPSAGITIAATVGDQVERGQPLCVLHHPAALAGDRLAEALRLIDQAYVIQADDPATTLRLGSARSRVLEILREPA